MNNNWNNIKGTKIYTSNDIDVDNVNKKNLYNYKLTCNRQNCNIDNIDININTIIQYECSQLVSRYTFQDNTICFWKQT